MTRPRSALVGLLAGALAVVGLFAASPADASCTAGGSCSGASNPTVRTGSYTGGGQSCSVYGNSSTMGSYCLGGGGDVQTLRERFGGQSLQKCRYRELPKGVPAPFNANAENGRYMMYLCLGNIDLDTYSGGPDKTLTVRVVWVPDGTDTADDTNQISQFVWEQFEKTASMPVPFMITKPNVIPIVGVPTYFTFRWVDPSNQNHVVRKGKYADKPNGGPYQTLDTGGFHMVARATKIVVDPNQKDIKPVTCAPETPYEEGKLPAQQPKDACQITFKRSSASIRANSTIPIPDGIKEAYYASVTVTWNISYGTDGDMRQLGDFAMKLKQVIPVQEVQAPNQPPAVVY